jgi:hypothetical protein
MGGDGYGKFGGWQILVRVGGKKQGFQADISVVVVICDERAHQWQQAQHTYRIALE